MPLNLPSKRAHHTIHVYQTHHRAAFAPVLLQIPNAVEAMRRSLAKRHPLPSSVFILDWDDTCCATSFLERYGFMADLDTRIHECAPELASHLLVLETRVLSLLKTAIKLGTVLIVTNAGDGWVELSSNRFLPAVRAFLDQNYKRIKIISARARYVDSFRDYPLQWKTLTFFDEIQSIRTTLSHPSEPLHVIVLGDSIGDQYAAHVATNHVASQGALIVLKVVKFLERPTIDQLCKELSVLLDHINAMAAHIGAFDVKMYHESPPSRHRTRTRSSHHQLSVQTQQIQHRQPSNLLPSTSTTTPTTASPMSCEPKSIMSSRSSANSTEAHTPLSPVSAMATCGTVV